MLQKWNGISYRRVHGRDHCYGRDLLFENGGNRKDFMKIEKFYFSTQQKRDL